MKVKQHKLILMVLVLAGVVCASWFVFYAFKLLNKSADEMRYYSAMSWLNAATREGLYGL
jgi:hypothetical protein